MDGWSIRFWIIPFILLALGGAGVIYIQLSLGNLAWLFPVGDGPVPQKCELVMTPGMKITFRDSEGDLLISAGNGLKRSFTWNGGSRAVELWPRIERWNGSFGGYFPGMGTHWFPHHGVFRCVVDEGQLNFSSTAKALRWLSKTPGYVRRYYRNDGLSIWVARNGPTLGVEVYQIYINGSKPSKLTGASDEKIFVVPLESISEKTCAPADSPDFTEGNASFTAAKRAAGSFKSSLRSDGDRFFEDHQYRLALNCYKQVLLAELTPHVLLQQARCQIELGDYDAALRSCDQAAEMSPNETTAARVKAEALQRRSQMR